LINPNNDTSFQEGTTMNGAVFIDGVGAVNGSTNASLKNYVHYGPNNELYLNKGQSVSFKLDFTGDVARVYLGMKRLLNAGSITIAVLDAQGKESSTKVITLNSKSELFYDLSAYNGYTIVIRNSSAADNALISLTNFKVTHIPTNTSEGGNDNQSSYSLFSMDMETANQVVSYLTNITIIPPVVDLDYPTISFEDEIFYNVYFNVDDLSNISEMGLVTFESKLADGTIADAKEVIPGYSVVGDCYTVRTNGISAKNMGDTVYFKVYAKLTDGSYVYSDIAGYNAVAYANTVLNSNASAEAKALVVAMLNYGAAAQTQFGYKTDSLMNASLTAEQQALVQAYSDSMVSNVISCEKPGSFVHNGGYTKVYPTVSFEGAFAINYYFNTAYTPDSAPVFYYWDAETYSNAEELTAENATGTMEMVLDGNSWVGIVDGISAKQIDQTFYTAAVYSVDGVSYYSPVVSYSLGAYCKSVTAQGNALGAAAAVYGYYAASYFNN